MTTKETTLSFLFSLHSVPMQDISSMFSAAVRVVSQALMIVSDLRRASLSIYSRAFQFGGVVPYIPQYLIIKRSQNAEGFSNYVCLTLLIANILRIEFWFGKHFELPLLVQSIVMIVCMIVMLELCIRMYSKSVRHHLPVSQQVLTAPKDSLGDPTVRVLTDFQLEYFWRWTRYERHAWHCSA